LLAQRKRTKRKGSRSLGHAQHDYPVLLTKCRLLGKSLTLRRVVFLHLVALLGCVKWLIFKTFLTFSIAAKYLQ